MDRRAKFNLVLTLRLTKGDNISLASYWDA